MNWQEHVNQAELLLKEAAQELAVAHTAEEIALVDVHVRMAHAHAKVAEVKRVKW